MIEPKHTPIATPRPWRITVGGGTIIGPDIAEGVYPQIVCGGADRGDQELIVRAVNAHEQLVGALENLMQAYTRDAADITHETSCVYRRSKASLCDCKASSEYRDAKAAIRAAKGEK